jgi:hypothetical protein
LFNLPFILAISICYVLEGTIKFSKTRLGCRYSVYELAEKHHGKVREGITDDGIYYLDKKSPHLSFRLLFKNETQAEDFESAVLRVPENYRKRKFPDSSEIVPDIDVQLKPLQRISIADATQLVRVLAMRYEQANEDVDGSPLFDVFSNSMTSAVEITNETRLRLIEREDSIALYCQKPEKCHIISQKRYKEDKYNPNNIIFMSRNLHQQFDAIDSSEGIPMFYVTYAAHHPEPVAGIVRGKPCQVYETSVNVVFKNEETMNVLSVFFKSYNVISICEIQLKLYFPAPEEFKEFAEMRAEDTIARWKSYDGILNS